MLEYSLLPYVGMSAVVRPVRLVSGMNCDRAPRALSRRAAVTACLVVSGMRVDKSSCCRVCSSGNLDRLVAIQLGAV